MARHILTYDIGSTSCKGCLYRLDDLLTLVAAGTSHYELNNVGEGGVEQNPDDWWTAMKSVTFEIKEKLSSSLKIDGISFCAQMQSLVLVDKSGKHLRPAMSYMDQRSEKQMKRCIGSGIKIEGINLFKLIKSLRINGAIAASAKDPVYKYLWVAENEPDIFERVYKWLDVKDYLIARATGVFSMTADSAFATFLTGDKNGKTVWNRSLMKMYGVEENHLPEICQSTDQVGLLTESAASELSLDPGIPVFGGGGDASMAAIGAGATRLNDTYIYIGTSGWVSTLVDKRKVDISSRIASIIGAQQGFYNYFAELETAGKCLEWVKDHLALDEINIYLEKKDVTDDIEARYKSLYEYLIHVIEEVPAGSNGVIFTPWLHGNRCPFEDTEAKGIFFNLGLETGKAAMIRAIVEGIMLHQKWMLDLISKQFPVSGTLTFSGGGALSPAMGQIMSDIMEMPVQIISEPQNVGTSGAALCASVGLGEISDLKEAFNFVPVTHTFQPRLENQEIYRRHYSVLKKLYPANRKLFRQLNS